MRRFGTLMALVLLSACSMSTPGGSPIPQPTRFQTAPTPSAGASTGVPASVPAARLQAIRDALAARGVDVAQLRVISAEEVTFNDGSLGCPQPGVHYTQALVNGMRVVVEAGGRSYDYRFGTGDSPRLCEPRRPGSASSTR